MRRSLPLLTLLCLAAVPAGADQLIQIPTADLVSSPTLEYLHRSDGTEEGYGTALFRLGTSHELMTRYYNRYDRQSRWEGGFQYQVLPDGIVTPGVAVGLWDVTNSSAWGRRGFLVITKSMRGGKLFVPKFVQRTQFTVGAGTGRFSGPLAALRFDLPARFTLVAEYDARRLNAGVWFSPLKPITLKAELQNGNPFLGGELRLGL